MLLFQQRIYEVIFGFVTFFSPFFHFVQERTERGRAKKKTLERNKKLTFSLVFVERFPLTAGVYQQYFCGATVNILNSEE